MPPASHGESRDGVGPATVNLMASSDVLELPTQESRVWTRKKTIPFFILSHTTRTVAHSRILEPPIGQVPVGRPMAAPGTEGCVQLDSARVRTTRSECVGSPDPFRFTDSQPSSPTSKKRVGLFRVYTLIKVDSVASSWSKCQKRLYQLTGNRRGTIAFGRIAPLA